VPSGIPGAIEAILEAINNLTESTTGKWAKNIFPFFATITLLVLAILAVVSLPSYAEYVRRGVRAEAQAFLIDVAAHQQQRLVGGADYAATIGDLGLAPPKSLAGKYVVSISVPSAAPPTFTVSATPQGPQAAESCGTLALSSTGERMPAHCWP
jgi:type IV pilus assembly protein PilE